MNCGEIPMLPLRAGKLQRGGHLPSVDHSTLVLPQELAKMTNGNPVLVYMWQKAGLPTIGCRCRRMDPGVAIPWLKEHGYIDEQGNARKWKDANS